MLDEFKKFIARGNVVDLAVGVIMGTAFGAIVSSLVGDIIMPPIGLALGGIDFSEFFIALNGESYPTLAAAKAVTINYGFCVNAIIKFIVVAFAVFVLVQQVNKLQTRLLKAKDDAPAAPTKDQELLAEIRDLLKRK